jgi:hypothetical protein
LAGSGKRLAVQESDETLDRKEVGFASSAREYIVFEV